VIASGPGGRSGTTRRGRSAWIAPGCAGFPVVPKRCLHLRCYRAHGDWQEFIAWSDEHYQQLLDEHEAVVIRSKKTVLRCRNRQSRHEAVLETSCYPNQFTMSPFLPRDVVLPLIEAVSTTFGGAATFATVGEPTPFSSLPANPSHRPSP